MVQTQSKLLEKFEVSQNKDITRIIFFLEAEEDIYLFAFYSCILMLISLMFILMIRHSFR